MVSECLFFYYDCIQLTQQNVRFPMILSFISESLIFIIISVFISRSSFLYYSSLTIPEVALDMNDLASKYNLLNYNYSVAKVLTTRM